MAVCTTCLLWAREESWSRKISNHYISANPSLIISWRSASSGIEQQQQQQVMKHIFYVTIRGNVENMCRARRHGKNIEWRKSWNGSSWVRNEADNFIDYQLIYVENLVLEKISINWQLTRSSGKLLIREECKWIQTFRGQRLEGVYFSG